MILFLNRKLNSEKKILETAGSTCRAGLVPMIYSAVLTVCCSLFFSCLVIDQNQTVTGLLYSRTGSAALEAG